METAGTILKAEREKQNKSLKKIAQELKVNIDYLKAIESDDYNAIPAEVFTKAW